MVGGVVKHLSSMERMPETIVVSLQDEVPVPKLFTNGSDFWPKDWVQLPFGENTDLMTRHLKEGLMPYLKSHFRATLLQAPFLAGFIQPKTGRNESRPLQ